MDYSLVMDISQSPSDISKLQQSCHHQQLAKMRAFAEKHTNPIRSASTLASTNSMMLPPTIHSDTITNRFSDIVTPNNGSTFG